jgi:hypothetical protein
VDQALGRGGAAPGGHAAHEPVHFMQGFGMDVSTSDSVDGTTPCRAKPLSELTSM